MRDLVQRQADKQLATLRSQAVVERTRIDLEEASAAYTADRRIELGYLMASRTAGRASLLHAQIEQASRGNGGLEANLRTLLEEPVMLASSVIIARYMNR